MYSSGKKRQKTGIVEEKRTFSLLVSPRDKIPQPILHHHRYKLVADDSICYEFSGASRYSKKSVSFPIRSSMNKGKREKAVDRGRGYLAPYVTVAHFTP